ncbi:MAG: gfo/Idh/MocA family oxidoreductase [Methylococcus sp.]|nr:MAG: gfo/Idh/MocA family oxidoreductase [Methylococcus sp.]
MKKIRTAVVGTGYLGKFHAEKYSRLPDSELVAVVDIDESAAREVAERFDTQWYTDYRAILSDVDAVSIVVPTRLHHLVARDFLRAGVHVLIEKPMTVTVEEAEELIEISREQGLVLQIGHLERFNAALLELDFSHDKPLFIESHRLSPFNPRANDVSVVLDLMIHDIDIILDLVDSEVDRIDASGTAVLTDGIDIANARLVFKSGCVANVTASRVSMKVERKMRMFRPQSYVSVDFHNRTLVCHRTGNGEMYPGIPEILTEQKQFENNDALREEICHFLGCIRDGKQPLVSGEAGKRALATAIEISMLLS